MRFILITILISIITYLPVVAFAYEPSDHIPLTDTLPPPPPPGPIDVISGPSSACTGDYCEYFIEVPLACSCQWSVDGIPQPGSGSEFTITWTQPGIHTVDVVFNCSGELSEPESITVNITGAPQPTTISGDNPVCEFTGHTYSTIVSENDSCQWTINGQIQAGFASSIDYTFGASGIYHFEVIAYNACGTGTAVYKDVSALYLPDVFLGNDTTIIQGQTLLLDAGNPGQEYLWSTGDTTQVISVNFAGEYSVNVSGPCGSDSDTIEVSVFIGIFEATAKEDCFTLTARQRTIAFSNLDKDVEKIRVYSLPGSLIYDGKPGQEITVVTGGIYFIQVFSPEGVCSKKIFIP